MCDDNHEILINGIKKTVWFSDYPLYDWEKEYGSLQEILVIDHPEDKTGNNDRYTKFLLLYFKKEEETTSISIEI